MNDAMQGVRDSAGTIAFVKELAKYYMDFLETDFHRRKSPKRSVRFRNAANLLVGINLARYPVFNQAAWKAILSGFTKDGVADVRKGTYRTAFPAALLQLIQLELQKISTQQLDALRTGIGTDLIRISQANKTDYDKALTETMEAAGERVRADLLLPFLTHIRKQLERLDLGDEDTLALIEEELRELLLEPVRNRISEVVRQIITDTAVTVGEQLRSAFQPEAIRPLVTDFFANYGVGDLFLELFELERNKSILDKQECYLYFCDLAYSGAKYPIFYIPFSLTIQEGRLLLEFRAQVYLNKRALEYVVQEENERTGKKGTLQCTADRIVYLSQHQGTFQTFLSGVLAEVSTFFQLDRTLDLADPTPQTAKSAALRMTNACYLALFDNSDEALLNDYEQILQLLGTDAGSSIAKAFNGLIDDFIHRNPESVSSEVQDEWDAQGVPERLVYQSPIPLNSEQRQILMALDKERCKYVTVEGPPGTGKSHTITAIICNSVLKNQSVLVLSDKKEALDVVEDKIASTLNRVRTDKRFQNPILRLGGTGNTYAQILSQSVMEDIKAHYRAVKKQHEAVEQSIGATCAGLKEDIEAEALKYQDISVPSIREWATLDIAFSDRHVIEFREVLAHDESAVDLEEFYGVTSAVNELRNARPPEQSILAALGFGNVKSIAELACLFQSAASLDSLLQRVETAFPGASEDLAGVRGLTNTDVDGLSEVLQKYARLRKPLIGYLFVRRALEALDQEFRVTFGFTASGPPHTRLAEIERVRNVGRLVRGEAARLSCPLNADPVALCQLLLTHPDLRTFLKRLAELADAGSRLPEIISKYPSTMQGCGVNVADFASIGPNRLTAMTTDQFASVLRYVSLAQQLRDAFRDLPEVNYAAEQDRVHDLVTVYMTYLMDGRVIEFYDNQKNTAKSLRDVIRSKQRFPQAEFRKLKDAFPCILAGVRDYAEYIPLEPEIFDLLVIDEASQVSIAQAFPALLRAKKILILGDKKQFSNVKAIQARADANREHLNRLEASFRLNVSNDSAKLVKMERFNIRTSILEFFEFITNYHSQLLKHFRSYKELISYSNTSFYRDKLQVMKIRGKNIDNVIKFTLLPTLTAEAPPKNRNSNQGEVTFVVAELRKIKEQGNKPSVGIITPHTDQQKLLADTIGKLPERDYFYKELRLKIMTFDTCQGEERDLIIYSMVANSVMDRLWGVFIKDLDSVDLEEDGKLKAQRLNVGFSRAKECVHIVLSKPLESYSGAVGQALRHFWRVREEAKKEAPATAVDPRSAREAQILTWFYQTKFWNAEKERSEFLPQFELGRYLKQLDPYYKHPEYRVDFLLVYRPDVGGEKKIIIEYDGFKEHFGEAIGVDASNYGEYYSEEDVYRQKVLESYGYKFIRINRFNLGDDSIVTLDQRIQHVIGNKSGTASNNILEAIHNDVKRLQEGGLRECPKCKELRSPEDFKDASLASGVGRFCRTCKGVRRDHRAKVIPVPVPTAAGVKSCPQCGARMALRTGRFGKFYGCTKYPYCHGTRQFAASSARTA
jgi:hypothetical protein